jgi:hypothetical protein
MGRNEAPPAAHPEDPLNSYRPASWRGVIITGVAILVVFTALWLAYGAALNNPDLQDALDGRQTTQGAPFPGNPEPGGN